MRVLDGIGVLMMGVWVVQFLALRPGSFVQPIGRGQAIPHKRFGPA